ncbi:hypothetical protein CSIV_12420 [Microbacterium sp. CSI-V]|uniref:hypothetical protein n=1 Tax=unclassified Microbacterium TaxID=2609290 RepID=UPI00097BE979|nr:MULTISPECIES: hypothetical protein [unclassified Microbacterium]MXS73681.1 hypothetical protein [Microbacterium sp. TL13]ONI62314.1 hypothetical protein CSIV_12420 [Microbacterium sp. CSI-V]
MTMDTDDGYDDLLAEPTPTGPWSPGEWVTIFGTITANFGVPFLDISKVYARGDVVQITEATIQHQGYLLTLADDEQAQLNRWGEVRIRRGRHEIERWTKPGDPIWTIEHSEARRVALAVVDHDERNAALRAVRDRFGAAPSADSAFSYKDLAAERRASDDAALRRTHGRHTYASS